MKAIRTAAAALVATGLLALGNVAAGATPPAIAADDGGTPIGVTIPEASSPEADNISNAQLRWGLNQEAGSGSFAGGCNFLSAGIAGNSGSATAWTAASGLYSSKQGAVTILRASGSGWEQPSFDTRCLDSAGKAVSVSSLTSATFNQVVIDGGTGSLGSGGLRIQWRGSFTVAFYGGMTYWSATDPVLNLDASGTGTLTATLSGYGTNMDDMTRWEPIPGRTAVLANISGADLGRTGGFSAVPGYLGVTASGAGQVVRSTANAAHWGAFPPSFVDFQKLTGQSGYWVTTGGQRDPAKPASPLYVNYDAASPSVVPTAPADGSSADEQPNNPLRQRSAAAAAAAADSAATAVVGGGGVPSTVARDGRVDLIPSASDLALPALLLPLSGMVLAVLVAILAALQLTGRLALPWAAPQPKPNRLT